MATTYDAIIVGARCAGAPTAMLLARKGTGCSWWTARRSPATPVHPRDPRAGGGGVAPVGSARRGRCQRAPPVETYSFDFGPSHQPAHRHEGISTAYAPRRTVLDKILVDAARPAGAEVGALQRPMWSS